MRIDGIEVVEGSKVTNLTVASGDSYPSNPNIGELFFRTDQDQLYNYKSAGWAPVGSGGGGGSYTITGDVSGTIDGGTDQLTLATVNSNAGSYGSNAVSVSLQVNSKGLVTSVGSTPIQITEGAITDGSLLARVADAETISGAWTFSANPTISNGAASRLFIDGNTSTARGIQFQTGGTNRWLMGANSTVESGLSAGSDFFIGSYNDTGGGIGIPFTISRATGNVTLTGNLSAQAITGTAITATTGITGTLTGAASLNVLKTGDTMTGNLTLSKSTPVLTLDTTSVTTQSLISLAQNGLARWTITKENTAEGGSNVGSNFQIRRYDDAGTFVASAISIMRSSGAIGMGVAIPSATLHVKSTGSASVFSDGTGTTGSDTAEFRATINGVNLQSYVVATGLAYMVSNAPTSYNIGTQGTAPLVFLTGNTERARISSDGYLLVGTTSVTDGSLLNVNGTVSAATPTLNTHLTTKAYVDAQLVSASSGPTVVVVAGLTQTAVTGAHYVMTGTGGASVLTFPTSPTVGALIWVSNYTGRTDLVIDRNGNNFMGTAENFFFDADQKTVQFRYINSTLGWIPL